MARRDKKHERRRAETDAESRVRISATDEHFRRLLRGLSLESRAEAERAMQRGRRLSPAEAERQGDTLVDLKIIDENAGLGGRHLVTLVKRRRTALPWTRLGVGSPVVLSMEKSDQAYHRAVISDRDASSVVVALQSPPDDLNDDETWRIDASSDEVATERQRAALERVRSVEKDRLFEMRSVLMGETPPEFDELPETPPNDKDFSDGLNAPQREAVALALAARDVALIHGPPGTGKTTTLVEVIRRAVARGEKVLASAPSNLAVDNVFARLLDAGVRVVRLGHPARVTPALRAHTLDLLVDEHEDVRLARKLVKEAVALFRKAERFTRSKPKRGAKGAMRDEARALLADARRLEDQAVKHILDTADVLCATTTGLDGGVIGGRRFDLAVIDEACQSTEPGCWIPLLRCDRVVLAGDHRQLPPTIVSPEAAAAGFGLSLFERTIAFLGPVAARRLSVQYRMHEAIMGFSSQEFYDGALTADPSVAGHLLCDLPGVERTPLTETPLELVDTAGAGYDEALEPEGESKLNPREAELVVRKVRRLLAAGAPANGVAVIAPYAAQVRLLRDQLTDAGVEVDTVDGFQGREKEAVIISLVRSNSAGEIGFLSDTRRMNVALTRARRKLIVIGDSATLSAEPFYRRMFDYFELHGAYHSVWEELAEGEE